MTKMNVFRLFLLGQILILSYSYSTPGMFYVFQQEWPGTVCDFYQCDRDDTGQYDGMSWTIHGLWPSAYQNNQCQELQFCTNSKYNAKLLNQQTDEELDEAWVGLYNPSWSFRVHEWQKHGTCWNDNDDLVPQQNQNPENEFFQTALELWKQYDLYSILKKAKILPNSQKFYYTDDIQSALSSVMNKAQVQFLCTKDKQNNLFLESISFCLNEKYQPIQCPCPVYGGIPCGKSRNERVYYPQYKE